MSARLARLAGTGTAAGAFSGLFGVGGGIVVVPLLILWLGYEDREAAGTSLAAIAIVALLGSIAQGVFGNVRVEEAALVGAPAMAGVVAGAALQQRISTRLVSVIFAGLLVVSAATLVV
jgi:uncharacterized membrane protein YfcA